MSSCTLEDPGEGILIEDIITLRFELREGEDDSTMFANGRETRVLVAALQDKADANQSIKFETDDGSFAGTADQKEQTLTASGKEARVELIAGSDPNDQVTISAKVGDFVVSTSTSFETISRANIFDVEFEGSDNIADANGIDRIKLNVTLREQASPNAMVKFTTSQGRFAEAEDGKPKEYSVKSSGGSAEARLISDRVPNDHVTVTVTVDGFSFVTEAIFAAIDVADVVQLGFQSDNIGTADGKDRIILVASIGEKASVNPKVTFKTDQGSFAGANGGKEIEILSNGGQALAEIITDNSPNSQITVSATVDGFTATSNVVFQEAAFDIDRIIQLDTDDGSALADGNDRIKLTATLGEDSDPNQDITFKTDQGTFAGTTSAENKDQITVKAAGRVADAFLISDQTVNSKVTVSAHVGDFKVSKVVRFERAYPTDLLIEFDRLQIESDQSNKATLTIKVFNDGEGYPSDDTRINFSQAIVGDDNKQEVVIPGFGFTNNGQLQIEVLSRYDSAGRVSITAEVNGAPSAVTDTIEIDIIKD